MPTNASFLPASDHLGTIQAHSAACRSLMKSILFFWRYTERYCLQGWFAGGFHRLRSDPAEPAAE